MPNSLLPSVLPVLRNLPPDLPREPLLPGLKRRPFSIFSLIFLALLAIALIFGAIQLASLPDDASPNATATGRVTQVEHIGDFAGAAQTAFIKYKFKAGNQLIYGNDVLQSGEAIPRVGDEIRVAYAPTRARDNSLAPTPAHTKSERVVKRVALIVVPFFILLWFTFMLPLLLPFSPHDMRDWLRARNLYRTGEIVPGRVQFVRNRSAPRSPNAATIHEIVATYSVEGVHYTVITRCDNAWLINQLPPEIEVTVAHDPLKPERAIILEPFAF